jgi:hypothetical protein
MAEARELMIEIEINKAITGGPLFASCAHI